MSRPIVLDAARPVASLREGLSLTTYAVGKALGGAASTCDSAERSGGAVQVSTLARAVAALGYRLQISLIRENRTEHPPAAKPDK